MPATKVTDAEIIALYQGGRSMHNIPACYKRVRRVLEENGVPLDLRSREVKARHRPPKNLERRPSAKQRQPGAWVADVKAMTRGQLDTLPRPLPEGASRTRTKLYERRMKEMTG